MTIIKNIDSVEDLNQIAYTPFTEERSDLLKFDAYVAFLFSKNDFSFMKNSINNQVPLQESNIFTEQDLQSPATLSTLSVYSDKLLFPFSRKVFYQRFLSNIIPNLADAIYENMKLTGRIVPIGSGLHKAFVINPQEYLEIPVFNIAVIDPKEVISNLNTSLTSINEYISTSSFYEEQISQRDAIIQQLILEIEQIKSQVMSAYQTTWR
jgi:hypothetical protein